MFPLVYVLAHATASLRVPVALTCQVLGFSTQVYRKLLKQLVSVREVEETQLIAAIRKAHCDDPEFGYREITDELIDQGHKVSRLCVWRLCKQAGVVSSTVRKHKPKNSRPRPAIHDDLVKRTFTASRCSELWLTDITEHRTSEGRFYVRAVKDVHSNRIAGYSIDSRMTALLAVDALNMAVCHRGNQSGVTVHSDRGAQFRSHILCEALLQYQLSGSMGRLGDRYDNSVIESFWGRMQTELLNRKKWRTRIELANANFKYLEIFHNRQRRHSALGMRTPIEYENLHFDGLTVA